MCITVHSVSDKTRQKGLKQFENKKNCQTLLITMSRGRYVENNVMRFLKAVLQ